MNEARIAISTAASLQEAERIASALVEQQLAACVNLIPQIKSIYRWQGEMEESSEVLLIIKSTAPCLPALESTLRSLHSYSVPEFLVLDVTSGSPAYLQWILDSVIPPSTPSKST
ncbi:MAG: divalent-cation tolerance protein CutA [Acidobacteriaceae bacterium]